MEDYPLQFTTAGVHALNVRGKYEIPIEVKGKRFTHPFYIINGLSQQDVCEWNLVGCQQSSAGFRYVTSLDFSDLRISGVSVPSEIALLENLRKLNFNPIAFEGTIPLELNRLTNLEIFEIKNNLK